MRNSAEWKDGWKRGVWEEGKVMKGGVGGRREALVVSSFRAPSSSAASTSPMASSSGGEFPAQPDKLLTDLQSGQGSIGKMDSKVREKRMGEILPGKFFNLRDQFLDRIIEGVEIPEQDRLNVEQTGEWRAYTRHKGPASANVERETQAVTLIQNIVRLYQASPGTATLRKEFMSLGLTEVLYHSMSVASLTNLPELEENPDLKPDLV